MPVPAWCMHGLVEEEACIQRARDLQQLRGRASVDPSATQLSGMAHEGTARFQCSTAQGPGRYQPKQYRCCLLGAVWGPTWS